MTEANSTPSGPSPLVQGLLVALLCLVWGSTWVVIKLGLEAGLPPITGGALRFTIAALAMVGVVTLLARRESGGRPSVWLSLSVGAGQFGINYAIVYWAETRLSSGLVCVLWATYPLFLAGFAHRMLEDEKLTRRSAIGLLTGFVGVLVLFAGDVRAVGPDGVFTAVVLLGSPLVAAASTAIIKRHGVGRSSLLITRDGMLFGAGLLWICAFAMEGAVAWDFPPAAWLTIGYLALIGSVLAFSVYFWLLRWAPASRLALITYATPPLALLFGAAFAGESVGTDTLLGTGLIVLGIALARKVRRAA